MFLRIRDYRRPSDLLRECDAMGIAPPRPDAISLRSETFAYVEGWDGSPLPKVLDPRPGKGRCLVHAPLEVMREELADHGLVRLARCIDRHVDTVREVRSPLWSHRFDRPLVMGILNVTPDSFSDGGTYGRLDDAVARARAMVEEGADLIDVGGESTRPGATPVPLEMELSRVLPVVERVSDLGVPVSVDTMKPEVARAAVGAGASIVNDVSGLRDPMMAETIKDTGAAAVVMHMRGTPRDMGRMTSYVDVMGDVMVELQGRIDSSRIDVRRVILDPGIGFAKNTTQNMEIISRIGEMGSLGRPTLIGASRKRFIGELTGCDVDDRLDGSIAAAVMAAMGGANVIRAHDIAPTVRAMNVVAAVRV